MSLSNIAFAVAKEFPLLEDDQLVVDELQKLGVNVTSEIWDDPKVIWSNYPIVVIRSPWDYYLKPNLYQQWLSIFVDSKTRLLNPPNAILRNIDKRYLLEFEKLGIPIIPSLLIEKSTQINLHQQLSNKNWNEVVIKPTISAGAWGTWRSDHNSANSDQEKFQEQVNKEAVLIQPFVPEILSEGEWSIIYFNGEYSHSVLKKAKANDYRVQDDHGGTSTAIAPSKEILQQTKRILDTQKEQLLYARVDGVIRNGQFLLMELEINEPSLFFAYHKNASKQFAQHISNALNDIARA